MNGSMDTTRGKPLTAGKIKTHLIWFDSMGAKSSSVLVETPDVSILIDPGAAVMQPSFPLPSLVKAHYCMRAFRAIAKAGKRADIIVISHYHYDHHTLLTRHGINAKTLYKGKTIWAKDPNQYINYSQWDRARRFYDQFCRAFGHTELADLVVNPRQVKYPDPMDTIPEARGKDYGDYHERKQELLEKGRKWFGKLSTKQWAGKPWVPELTFGDVKVKFADGREMVVGKTKVKFSPPFFHGIEFDRVGWVFTIGVKHEGKKFLYSSDIQGPMIEDYATYIVGENPDLLIMDGPPTYMFGYMLNRINLNRSIDNLCNILRRIKAKVVVYDHHLPRDRLFKQRVSKVYQVGREEGKQVLTAAEYLGDEPMVLKASKVRR